MSEYLFLADDDKHYTIHNEAGFISVIDMDDRSTFPLFDMVFDDLSPMELQKLSEILKAMVEENNERAN